MTPDQTQAQADDEALARTILDSLVVNLPPRDAREYNEAAILQGIRAARGEAIRDAKAQALRYFGGYAATHRALNLGGFLEWCDKAAALDVGKAPVKLYDGKTESDPDFCSYCKLPITPRSSMSLGIYGPRTYKCDRPECTTDAGKPSAAEVHQRMFDQGDAGKTCHNHFSDGSKIFPSRECQCDAGKEG